MPAQATEHRRHTGTARNGSPHRGRREAEMRSWNNRVGRWFRGFARRSPLAPGGSARIGARHIYILPTGTGVLFGIVLALMLLGSLNYQNNLALLFTFLLGSVAIVGMHHTWFNLLDLEVSARGGSPVYAGREATFSLRLRDDRGRARPDLRVRVGNRTSRPVHLKREGEESVDVSVPSERRGSLALETVLVESRYPLGLFRAWCYPETDARVTVYPRPARQSPAPPLIAVQGRSPHGDLGEGADDFVGPRDYRTGDPLRRLDWKALARERGLVVKQFGGDRAARVWIDWERLADSGTEERIRKLCRQILDAADKGLNYGLRLPGSEIPLGHGEMHRHRCLEALAFFGHEAGGGPAEAADSRKAG